MTEGVSRAIVICSRCKQRSPRGVGWEETLDWYATHEPCMKSPQSPQESFAFGSISVDIVLDDKKLAELDEARGRGVLRFSETIVDPMDDD